MRTFAERSVLAGKIPWPWPSPQRVFKDNFQVLCLGLRLESQVLGPGLENQVPGLGLEAQVLGLGLAVITGVLPPHDC